MISLWPSKTSFVRMSVFVIRSAVRENDWVLGMFRQFCIVCLRPVFFLFISVQSFTLFRSWEGFSVTGTRRWAHCVQEHEWGLATGTCKETTHMEIMSMDDGKNKKTTEVKKVVGMKRLSVKKRFNFWHLHQNHICFYQTSWSKLIATAASFAITALSRVPYRSALEVCINECINNGWPCCISLKTLMRGNRARNAYRQLQAFKCLLKHFRKRWVFRPRQKSVLMRTLTDASRAVLEELTVWGVICGWIDR